MWKTRQRKQWTHSFVFVLVWVIYSLRQVMRCVQKPQENQLIMCLEYWDQEWINIITIKITSYYITLSSHPSNPRPRRHFSMFFSATGPRVGGSCPPLWVSGSICVKKSELSTFFFTCLLTERDRLATSNKMMCGSVSKILHTGLEYLWIAQEVHKRMVYFLQHTKEKHWLLRNRQ